MKADLDADSQGLSVGTVTAGCFEVYVTTPQMRTPLPAQPLDHSFPSSSCEILHGSTAI